MSPESPKAPPKHRVKVAVLVGALEVGGAELDIVRNFPRLNRDEFDVVVVSFGTRGALGPELERQGIRVVARVGEATADEGPQAVLGPFGRFVRDTPEGIKRPLRRMLSALLRLPPVAWTIRRTGSVLYMGNVALWIRRTLDAEHTDIAHFFLPHSYVYGMVATALLRRRTRRVMSRLSLNFYKDTHAWIAWLERNLMHYRVDIAIGNSTSILDELVEEGVDRSRVRLLYNGIDPGPFARHDGDRSQAREALGIEQDSFVVVSVGNLHTYKGHRDLIEACSQVRERLPAHWRVLIAGRDETGNRAAYETLVADLGLSDHIALLGPCDNVPQLLFAADVFAHPSHHEGLPNAIIEAMAASLPVIGTTVGGIPEVVTAVGSEAETGWLVPPCDPAALAAALVDASTDPSRRIEMGERARQRVRDQFSLDKSVSTYEAIYRELMS